MIFLLLVVMYSLLMLVGAGVAFRKTYLEGRKVMALSFYVIIHLLFLSLAMRELFGVRLTIFPYLIVIVLVLLSRFINGKILYNKNHWHHYIVFGLLFLVILLLKFLEI